MELDITKIIQSRLSKDQFVDELTDKKQIYLHHTAGGPDASATYIRKLTKKIAIDFSGNRYSWFVDNDSSGDQLIIASF